ncbi:hypothetical protein TNCV_2081171 [Trichonephila clavipes]|nr:hypothetical protein TNCV_2081171 [Trichonephila clavipes]
MLKHLRIDILELQEMKLPGRLINTKNERRLVRGHGGTRQLRGGRNEISNMFPVNWTMSFKCCISWMKHPEFYRSRRIRHLIKPVKIYDHHKMCQ